MLSKEGDLEPGVVRDQVLLPEPSRMSHIGQGGAAEYEATVCSAVELEGHNPGTVRIEPVAVRLRLDRGNPTVFDSLA